MTQDGARALQSAEIDAVAGGIDFIPLGPYPFGPTPGGPCIVCPDFPFAIESDTVAS